MPSLFKDIEDLASVLPNTHYSAEDVLRYVEDAEDCYMEEYLGTSFLEGLVDDLESAGFLINSLSSANQKIVPHLRKAAAYYGMYDALEFINVNLSNVGAMSHNSNETTPIRQWEYKEARKNAILKADRFMDKALSIMEGTPTDYPTWQSSAEFTQRTKYLITNADDFKDLGLVDINGSRRTYLKLVPFIDKVERNQVTDCVGATLLTTLKANILAGTATAQELKLLNNFIYPSLAHFTVYEGAPSLNLDVSASGLRLVSTSDGITTYAHNEKAYAEWRHHLLMDAKRYLNLAKSFLDENTADFPDYVSDQASENDTPDYTIGNNLDSKSSIIL